MAALVRTKGLEPPHLSIPEPKSGASTSFATSACGKIRGEPLYKPPPKGKRCQHGTCVRLRRFVVITIGDRTMSASPPKPTEQPPLQPDRIMPQSPPEAPDIDPQPGQPSQSPPEIDPGQSPDEAPPPLYG